MSDEIELKPFSIRRESGESDVELRDRLCRKNASLLRKLKDVRQRRKADIRHYETVLRYADKSANDSALRETALIEENKRLREALTFYAKGKHLGLEDWQTEQVLKDDEVFAESYCETGKVAREALEGKGD